MTRTSAYPDCCVQVAGSNLRCMREILGPPLRIAAIGAFVTGLALLFLDPPSFARLPRVLLLLAGAIAFLIVMAWLTVALIGEEMPEPEFRRLVDRSEALASLPPPDQPPSEFDLLVMEALDRLPEQFRELLERTPVVVSSRGHEHRAYGQYVGGTIARDIYPDRIVIYQDTLERDFGHDPELLRAQVERTVRHELGHHLGWDERGVRALGL
jgi:predicted Zn-dependent protease with MMP-like domain